jgi:lipoprotein-releasing system ATP-binding protein|tara:strand:- start:4291 stop:4944 length:654 start_codon:yes stop_codon:yes gene_type:complete
VIKALNISKKYGELNVLNSLNLEVKKGEVVSIVGASGAGKTTLLQILGTLDKPNEGNLFINETDITLLSSKKLAAFRNKEIGFIFQFHQLLPEFTALENVCIPAYIAGKSKSEAEKEALDYLKFLKLEHRISHKPAELSGGEQQRVAVARALINQPSVVLADEPSGNLDSKNAKELHDLFFELREKFDQTFIIVTHNDELANMADRKLTIQDGVIVE